MPLTIENLRQHLCNKVALFPGAKLDYGLDPMTCKFLGLPVPVKENFDLLKERYLQLFNEGLTNDTITEYFISGKLRVLLGEEKFFWVRCSKDLI